MKKFLAIFGLVVLFVMNSAGAFAQCAMCRGSVESSMGNGRNNVGVGLNTGIMFLFVVPYILVAVIGYLWYRNSKKAQAERQFVAARVRSAYDN